MSARRIVTAIVCLLALAALSACQPAAPTATVESATPTPIPTADKPLLTWQGQTDAGCSAVTVSSARLLSVGLCGQQSSDPHPILQEDSLIFLDAMSERLGPIADSGSADHLVFAGSGSESSAAWRGALVSWARWTFAEDYSGHACAACRTVLSWSTGPVGDDPDVCGHLTVLNFGVAYAETGPCEGNKWTLGGRAVLSTERWETFDGWVAEYQTYDDGVNSFGGKGSEPLNGSLFVQIDDWLKAAYPEVASENGN